MLICHGSETISAHTTERQPLTVAEALRARAGLLVGTQAPFEDVRCHRRSSTTLTTKRPSGEISACPRFPDDLSLDCLAIPRQRSAPGWAERRWGGLRRLGADERAWGRRRSRDRGACSNSSRRGVTPGQAVEANREGVGDRKDVGRNRRTQSGNLKVHSRKTPSSLATQHDRGRRNTQARQVRQAMRLRRCSEYQS